MIYREQTPKGELARFVDCFWFLDDGDDPAAERPLEHLLPIGSIEVVIHHRSPFREWPDERQPRTLPPGVIAGQLTRALSIQPAGPISTMGVRFLPGGAYPFLGTSLDALTDRIVSFAEVWGGEGDRLEERLVLAANDAERVQAAEGFLLSSENRLAALDGELAPLSGVVHAVHVPSARAGEFLNVYLDAETQVGMGVFARP